MNPLFAALPFWAQSVLMLGGLALGLVFLLLPFAIFGVKPRLEEIELQLSELRAELRTLSLRASRHDDARPVSPMPADAPVQHPPQKMERHAAPMTGQPPQPVHRDAPMPWNRASESNRADPVPTSEPQRARAQPSPHGSTGSATPSDMSQNRASPPSKPPSQPFAFEDMPAYEDLPAPDHVTQILRPTHFEPPPAREAPRPPPATTWDAPVAPTPPRPASFSPLPDVSTDPNLLRRREEMSPRPLPEEDRRRRSDESLRDGRPRSEPTLRWPPHP
ncbi:hypothetical protein [Brytella acorum]|uniref:Uncharacterized protein n=1 Tax=Brytella acorum TaxID=2959299 RepID=A0AA35Y2X4_9PROT|nr:hypothetical protein [Brytella acorum]MDF3625412.1 hypothetical protein [Brytella acorum]CAI9120263.1 hypothetical protein LMG32879_001095 [Brytella acorum]